MFKKLNTYIILFSLVHWSQKEANKKPTHTKSIKTVCFCFILVFCCFILFFVVYWSQKEANKTFFGAAFGAIVFGRPVYVKRLMQMITTATVMLTMVILWRKHRRKQIECL